MVSVPDTGGICEPWATAEDACSPCDDLDSDLLTRWMDAASSILYALTGYRWAGQCSDLVYPTSEECLYWLRISRRSGLLGRRDRRSLKLPGYPVVEVTEVLIDGVAVDPELYRVDDQQYLVYQPESLNSGTQNWPVFNDVRLPPGSVGTWSVEYVYGVAPPPGGKEAAAALGCELAKSCSADDEDCRLPARVTSITRQGVTMAVLDPLTLFQDGLTGLPEVDLWVSAMNRGNARRPAQVWVPGQRRKVRRTDGTPLDYYGGGY